MPSATKSSEDANDVETNNGHQIQNEWTENIKT
jgi:hypothetical protein